MQRCFAVLAVAFGVSASAFSGDIRILTDPEGAEVSQGSMHLGATTKEGLRVVGVEPGTVTFTISKPGFETVTRVVSVESATEPITVLVRLRPTETRGTTETTPTTPKVAASPAVEKKKGGSKTALIILGGAAAVGGGVAIAAGGSSSSSSPTTTTTTLPPTASLADLSATVSSDQQGRVLNCKDTVFFTVSLTNRAPALVRINGVRRHLSATTCGGSTADFTYTPTNLAIGTGTADVLNHQEIFRGGVGCCSGSTFCSGACHVQYSFTVLTSVGEVPAGSIDYGIVFDRCVMCSSFEGFGAAMCPLEQ